MKVPNYLFIQIQLYPLKDLAQMGVSGGSGVGRKAQHIGKINIFLVSKMNNFHRNKTILILHKEMHTDKGTAFLIVPSGPSLLRAELCFCCNSQEWVPHSAVLHKQILFHCIAVGYYKNILH